MHRGWSRSLLAGLVMVLALSGAGTVSAQETLTPVFKAPFRAFEDHEFGAVVSFPEAADFGVEGFYTYGRDINDFGLRAGLVDSDEGTRWVAGGNFRTRLLSIGGDIPIDGALTVGAGVQAGDGPDLAATPVGVSLGTHLPSDDPDGNVVVYVHPVIVPVFGGGDSDVNFALGAGANLRLGNSLSLRASAGIGDIEGVSIGLAWVR